MHDAEQRCAEATHGTVGADAHDVPERAEQDRQHEDEPDRRLALPVDRKGQGEHGSETEQHSRLVAGDSDGVVELDGGERQRNRDDHEGGHRTDSHGGKEQDCKGNTDDDRHRHVSIAGCAGDRAKGCAKRGFLARRGRLRHRSAETTGIVIVVEPEKVVGGVGHLTQLHGRRCIGPVVGQAGRGRHVGPGSKLGGLGLGEGRLRGRFEGHRRITTDLRHRPGRRLAPVRDGVVVLLEGDVVVAEDRTARRRELVDSIVDGFTAVDDSKALELVGFVTHRVRPSRAVRGSHLK